MLFVAALLLFDILGTSKTYTFTRSFALLEGALLELVWSEVILLRVILVN